MDRPGCLVAAIGAIGFMVAGIVFGSWILFSFGIFFPVVVLLANNSG
jgi:hypothetical protein